MQAGNCAMLTGSSVVIGVSLGELKETSTPQASPAGGSKGSVMKKSKLSFGSGTVPLKRFTNTLRDVNDPNTLFLMSQVIQLVRDPVHRGRLDVFRIWF